MVQYMIQGQCAHGWKGNTGTGHQTPVQTPYYTHLCCALKNPSSTSTSTSDTPTRQHNPYASPTPPITPPSHSSKASNKVHSILPTLAHLIVVFEVSTGTRQTADQRPPSRSQVRCWVLVQQRPPTAESSDESHLRDGREKRRESQSYRVRKPHASPRLFASIYLSLSRACLCVFLDPTAHCVEPSYPLRCQCHCQCHCHCRCRCRCQQNPKCAFFSSLPAPARLPLLEAADSRQDTRFTKGQNVPSEDMYAEPVHIRACAFCVYLFPPPSFTLNKPSRS